MGAEVRRATWPGIASHHKNYMGDMVQLSGGSLIIGSEVREGLPQDGERSVCDTTLTPFPIVQTTVTDQQLSSFAEAAGYRTEIEKYGWSGVFYALLSNNAANNYPPVVAQRPWWCAVARTLESSQRSENKMFSTDSI